MSKKDLVATGVRLLSLTARQVIKESDDIVEAVAKTTVQVVQNSTKTGGKGVRTQVKSEVMDAIEKLKAQGAIALYKKVNAPKPEIGRNLDTGRTYNLSLDVVIGKQNAKKLEKGWVKTYGFNGGWINGFGSSNVYFGIGKINSVTK